MKANSHSGISNRLKYQILEDGKVVRESDWQPNLILGQGMDQYGSTYSLCDSFLYAVIGSGNTATSQSSGSVTVTTSGTTATASGSIFSSTDVGALLVLGNGNYAKITAYTSATVVTLSAALNVSVGTVFTIYFIGQTGLATEIKRTNTYSSVTGSNQTTIINSGTTLLHQRTFLFPVEVSNVNYSEVGFSNSGTAGGNLFSRALLTGYPIFVLQGQQLVVIYQVAITVGPVVPTNGTANVDGWPSLAYPVTFDYTSGVITAPGGYPNVLNTPVTFQGGTAPAGITFGTVYYIIPGGSTTFQIASSVNGSALSFSSNGTGVNLFSNTNGTSCAVGQGASTVQSSGASSNPVAGCFEPSETASRIVGVSTDTSSFVGYPNGTMPSILGSAAATAGSYVNGSYTQSYAGTLPAGTGASDSISKIFLGNSGSNLNGFVFFFTWPQQVSNQYTLTLVFQMSWGWAFA